MLRVPLMKLYVSDRSQGDCRAHGPLVPCLLWHGLPRSSGKSHYSTLRDPFSHVQQKRLFHIITGFITTFAFLSYFAMATGDGISYSKYTETEKHDKVPDIDHTIHRQIYWARYVDWSVTTPLLLLDLALLAGLSGANILVAIVADIIMVLTGMFAAFGQAKESQKWGWYAWGCIAYLVVVYQLAIGGRETVSKKDGKTKAFYGSIAGFTLLLWTIYPM